jgi:hypothetical protein
MIWFMVMQVASTLVELVTLGRQSESDKDLDILLPVSDGQQQRLILNLTDFHQRILGLLGQHVQQCYL